MEWVKLLLIPICRGDTRILILSSDHRIALGKELSLLSGGKYIKPSNNVLWVFLKLNIILTAIPRASVFPSFPACRGDIPK